MSDYRTLTYFLLLSALEVFLTYGTIIILISNNNNNNNNNNFKCLICNAVTFVVLYNCRFMSASKVRAGFAIST